MKRLDTSMKLGWAVALVGLSGAAQAHTGDALGAGLVHGFAHPLGGLDHVLAMVAVGLWAGQLGGSAVWRVPLAFVGMMVVGGLAGLLGAPLSLVELGIAGSLVAFGALIASAARVPVWIGMALVGLFAVFHGHAHGAEMPAAAAPLLYALGFVGATALLHALGVGLGLCLRQDLPERLVRVGGGAIGVAGLVLAVGF